MQDWVVLYFHADNGCEAQRTIVTEMRGIRVVRGEERECVSAYERAAGRLTIARPRPHPKRANRFGESNPSCHAMRIR
jgi:hypothetical protein